MRQYFCCSVRAALLLECHGILRLRCMTILMESDDLSPSKQGTMLKVGFYNLPPSSLAITSALSSTVVYAIELFELPNAIPIACLSAGVIPFILTSSPAIFPGFLNSVNYAHRINNCCPLLLKVRCIVKPCAGLHSYFLVHVSRNLFSGF